MAEAGAVVERVEFVVDELIARPYRPDDAPALAEAVHESQASLATWLDWCHPGYALADAEQWIAICASNWQSGDAYTFAVFDATANRFLGAVGIDQRNRRCNCAGIGYWVRQSARGRGIVALDSETGYTRGYCIPKPPFLPAAKPKTGGKNKNQSRHLDADHGPEDIHDRDFERGGSAQGRSRPGQYIHPRRERGGAGQDPPVHSQAVIDRQHGGNDHQETHRAGAVEMYQQC